MEKLEQDHCFLKISLRTEAGGEVPESPVLLKAVILQSLQSLHGHVGAAIPVDILHYSLDDVIVGGATLTSAVLRVPHRDQVKVWSALTAYCGPATVCTVDKASTSLLSLAVNSREFDFPL